MGKNRFGLADLDMTSGSIAKVLLTFAIPLILGNLFQQLYNTVDSLVVGNFVGREALAAVGSTTCIVNTLVKFFNGVSIGAGVVISQAYGAKDQKHLHASVGTTMAVTFFFCVLFTLIGYFASPLMLKAMSTPADVFPLSLTYLQIYFLGLSGLLIYNMGSGILRAVGNTTIPLIFLIFTSLLNIVLDLFLVLVIPMGIAGVALATTISQIVSAVLILLLLAGTKEDYRFSFRELCLEQDIVKRIITIGFPTGIQQSLTSLSNVFVHGYINAYGSYVMAGWSCYAKIDQFVMLPMQSMGHASTTFVGQNIGAKNNKRAKEGAWKALQLSLIITSVMAILVWKFAPQMTALFNQDNQVIKYGTLVLRTNVPFMVFCCINQVFASALRGSGDAKTPMYYLLFSQVVFRQIYLFIISRILPGRFIAVSIAFPLGWMVCSVLMSIHFGRMNWEKTGGEESR